MTGKEIDDETLMAHADGELDVAEAERVEAALRDDPELAKRLAVFTRTRDALKAAAEVRHAEPLPEKVVARARSAIDASRVEGSPRVVPLVRPDRPLRFLPVALAASLAVAAFLGGYFLSPNAQPSQQPDLHFAILDTPGLSDALGSIPAGQSKPLQGGEITLVASFRDAGGALCREFELDTTTAMTVISVACWSGAGWDPRLALVATADDGTQYAPASSLETLDAYLASIGASPPLSSADEVSALSDVAVRPE